MRHTTRFFLMLLVGLGLLPFASDAHPLDPILVEIVESPHGLDLEMRYPLAPRPGLTPLDVDLPHCCEALPIVDEKRAGGLVRKRWRADCEGRSLAGRTLTIRGLAERDNDALIRVLLENGETVQTVLSPDRPYWRLPEQNNRSQVAWDYGSLGFEHILTGWDHLLFILGLLLLVPSRRSLIATITAFTIGHSITLCLAVLDAIAIPPQPIETAIAASLIVLALELLRLRAERPSFIGRHPALLAGGFGLLHGLGFAGALEQVGLPSGEIPLALVSFNVGIELGQLGFVAVIFAIYFVWLRARSVPPMRPPLWVPAYVIGGLSFFWMLERAASSVGLR